MSRKALAPDVMAGLKEFQRDTVEYVFKRMYTDPDSSIDSSLPMRSGWARPWWRAG